MTFFQSEIRIPHSTIERSLVTVFLVLLQFSVESLASDAECAGGARLIAARVIERGFDGLAFDLVNRGGDVDFQLNRAPCVRCFSALAPEGGAFVQHAAADGFRQIVQIYAAPRSNDDGALNRVLKLADVAGPVVFNQSM